MFKALILILNNEECIISVYIFYTDLYAKSLISEIKLEEAAVLHYTYTKFSDLTSRRDRCGCKPTKEDVKRCFMLDFDRSVSYSCRLHALVQCSYKIYQFFLRLKSKFLVAITLLNSKDYLMGLTILCLSKATQRFELNPEHNSCFVVMCTVAIFPADFS